MTAPKLTEAQRECACGEDIDLMFGRCRDTSHRLGWLVPVIEANRGPSGQRQGPAWFHRWDVWHDGGACAGCSDGKHSLHFTMTAARAWAKQRGITLVSQ